MAGTPKTNAAQRPNTAEGIADRVVHRWPGALVFIFSVLIYANTIPNDYNLDDHLVTRSHRLTARGIAALPDIFREPYYKDNAGYAYEYRPVTLASFAIEHALFGENPHISHFINVILYGVLCLLLYRLLRILLSGYHPLLTLFIVLLFAAHPIHTEVVASIKNRDELLAVIFGLLAWHSALRYCNERTPAKWRWLPGVALGFLAGMLAKQTIVVLAALMPASLIIFRGVGWRQVAALYATLAMVMFPVLNLPNVTLRLQVMAAPALFLIFILFLMHYQGYYTRLSELLRRAISAAKGRERPENATASSLTSTAENEGIDAAWLPVLSVAALTGFFTAWYFASKFWMYAALILLGALLVPAGYRTRPVIYLMFASAALFLGFYGQVEPMMMLVTVLVTGAVISFNAKGAWRYALWIILAGILAGGGWLRGYYWGVLVPGFVWSVMKFSQRTGRVVMVLSLIAAVFLITFSLIGSPPATLWRLVLLLGSFSVLSFILIRKYPLRYVHAVFMTALIGTLMFTRDELVWEYRQPVNMEKLAQLNWENPLNITPKNLNRPLQFIEAPVHRLSPLSEKIGTASYVLLRYLKLSLFPYPMRFYYGYREIEARPWTDGIALTGAALHGAFFIVACLLIVRRRLLPGFGLLFYLVSIASFSNFVTIVPGIMGDRFLFIPVLGIAMLIGSLCWYVFKISEHTEEPLTSLPVAARASMLALLAIYSLMTIARNTDWKDELTLYRNDIRHLNNSAKAQDMFGVTLLLHAKKTTDPNLRKELLQEAVVHLKRSTEISPDYKNPWFDLGQCYLLLGKLDEAYAAYERTLQLDSAFIVPCLDMAIIQYEKKNYRQAIPLFEKYLQKFPQNLSAYANLSYCYFMLNDYEKSIAVSRAAMVHFPYNYEPYINIGKVYLKQQKLDSALYYFRKTQQFLPNDARLQQTIHDIEKTLKR
ncbi:MAG: tetratricopeptide repeat protein [Chitinophagales bacterium]|nr:tetratricopeptide repeat protein [Chitinophagales bacterium]MDW8419192.1 tetratricopeptide repeat protein [Chitinophagales bacterium]